ncbi:30S ribosomal protein S20 [Enterococcus hirae]|nr:30S ribosomal protein S20 [Enterococcaceae bacterium]MCI1919900.1 30S ribosomal protein S20 [Enterococcaceae bacterium]MDM8213265.1 30S ribosomal protein S20 [Enterococcus hirae]
MPQIKSAIKRVKTNEKAKAHNAAQMSALRTAVKKFEQAVETGADDKEAAFKTAIKAIDMAETKGLIHQNKASRDKARLSRLLAK